MIEQVEVVQAAEVAATVDLELEASGPSGS
jgi:hypothetical protein